MKVRMTVKIPNWLDRICAWPVMEYRKHKYGYPFRRIHLTEGKYAIVDQQDFYWLNNFDWCLKKEQERFYAIRFNNYCDKGPKIVSLHRQIMNPPDGLLIDHRNRNGLDDRRENLRIATFTENNLNKPKRKNTSSRFMGVSFDKGRGNWKAHINYEKKYTFLGRFDSEIEAAKAYDEAARKYHGEFARLNFP